jgi:gamma-glutamyltranspeptidase / glutathione hydrolase
MHRPLVTFLPAVFATLLVVRSVYADTAIAKRAMVATNHSLATNAAVEVLREGGNAVDAAVTAALTLGVVDGENSGIGGGCLILVRTADGKLVAIDGREMAPGAAHKDMYLRDGKPVPNASQTGPLASGVPGALAAYDRVLRECGTIKLARALAPGLDTATNGFEVDRSLAGAIRETSRSLKKFEGSRGVYFKSDGEPYKEGERLVQADLANTYRNVAEHGIDWFYRGPFAERVGAWMAKNGGIMTAADFATYEAKQRTPLETTYRGRRIIGFPPPSSGGIHVAQVLNILEPFDMGAIHKRDPIEAAHIIAEAFKLAFADRAYWLGDADFADVPRGLIDKAYAKSLSAKIDPAKAIDVPDHGTPPKWNQDLFSRHTTHIAAADAAGNWVGITATVNTTLGSKVIVPGTGVVLNNEMDDFSIYPGQPNAFGLIGAENNSVAPRKRPLSSMSPTIVLDESGKPIMTLGAAGGPKIITQVLLTIIRVFDFGESLPDAVGGPRIHHQWRPNVVMHERDVDGQLVERLRQRGHNVEDISSGGREQAIGLTADGELIGVADPRAEGTAAGL